MEHPRDEGADGDVDPDKSVAKFVEFLEEAGGDEGDEEPDEEVIYGGELAGIREVFDALASALGVCKGGEEASEFEEAEIGGRTNWDGGTKIPGLEVEEMSGSIFTTQDVSEFGGVKMGT